MKNFLLSATTVLLIASGCTMSNGTTGKDTERPLPPDNMETPPFIIDAHVHYRANDEWEEAFIEKYTEYNAMGCVMVRLDDLDRGIAFANEHPDRVIPYASLDIDSNTIIDDIRRAHELGYKGLGELFARGFWNYDDEKYEPIWSLTEELGLVLAPHTGIHGSGNFARMRPSYLASIAERHRGLEIVGAHFGNPWYAEAAEAARLNPNLHFDISGTSLIKKSLDPWFWKDILWWTPFIGKPHVGSRAKPAWPTIVFATDEGPDAFESNILRFNRMLDAAEIPDSTRAKMYGLTMAEIHGIMVETETTE